MLRYRLRAKCGSEFWKVINKKNGCIVDTSASLSDGGGGISVSVSVRDWMGGIKASVSSNDRDAVNVT